MTRVFGRFRRLRENRPLRVLLAAGLAGGALALVVAPVDAPVPVEVVHFASGDVMPVAGHRIEGDTVILSLLDGGEILFDARRIERIELAGETAPRPAGRAAEAVEAGLPAKPYAALVRDAAARHRVEAAILHAVIEVESVYRADAESPRGAKGLMQLMPDTVARYQVQDPFDPAANVDAGARYLRYLFDQFGMRGGLAAYNAGEGAVQRHGGGIPPYAETARYVERVLEIVGEIRGQSGGAPPALAQ